MSTQQQVGSKLANSVRRAKEQQTQEEKPKAKTATPKRGAAETSPPVLQLPSRRVWPD